MTAQQCLAAHINDVCHNCQYGRPSGHLLSPSVMAGCSVGGCMEIANFYQDCMSQIEKEVNETRTQTGIRNTGSRIHVAGTQLLYRDR